jgi:hypothetical protein
MSPWIKSLKFRIATNKLIFYIGMVLLQPCTNSHADVVCARLRAACVYFQNWICKVRAYGNTYVRVLCSTVCLKVFTKFCNVNAFFNDVQVVSKNRWRGWLIGLHGSKLAVLQPSPIWHREKHYTEADHREQPYPHLCSTFLDLTLTLLQFFQQYIPYRCWVLFVMNEVAQKRTADARR